MKASDVTDTLELALTASGCDQAHVLHKPRLLSDNGASYVSGELAHWLGRQNMSHVRGAPYHPQTQGKIERWHQTLKNRILLEHYYLPSDLETQVAAFIEHYNHRRYHESLQNLTPRRRLLRARPNHLKSTRGHQTPNNPKSTLGFPQNRGLIIKPDEPKSLLT